jgi:hypothetical protein
MAQQTVITAAGGVRELLISTLFRRFYNFVVLTFVTEVWQF